MNTLLPLLNLVPPKTREMPATCDQTPAVEAAPAPLLQLDRRTYQHALACQNCGQCLPVCPTYQQTGHEAESPRGRIALMKGMSDGFIDPTRKVREHLDSCLNCRACETACPSNVVYHELIEETRDRLGKYDKTHPPAFESYRGVLRWFVRNVVTHPRRLKMAVAPIRVLQRGKVHPLLQRFRVMELLPPALRKMEQMLPEHGPIWPRSLPRFTGAKGMDAVMIALQNTALLGKSPASARGGNSSIKLARKTAGFFAGCVGSIFLDRANRMAIDLMAASGVDVYVPRAQGCCGAIHKQTGCLDDARKLARKNIDLFLPRQGTSVDFIVTNIAGCGAALLEYDVLLRDDLEYADLASEFRRRFRDISKMLAELNLPELAHPVNLTAAYQDSCQLAHGQKLGSGPRDLLARIPGLNLVELPEGNLCCGGAGTYNLEHPETATELANRKLDHLAAAGVSTLISPNVGCASHLAAQARQRRQTLRIVHPVELLHEAVFGVCDEYSSTAVA
jgi:glycolate oxidase iron-sulfur subunit